MFELKASVKFLPGSNEWWSLDLEIHLRFHIGNWNTLPREKDCCGGLTSSARRAPRVLMSTANMAARPTAATVSCNVCAGAHEPRAGVCALRR